MKLTDFRAEIQKHNAEHPELAPCIYPSCINKIKPLWDNQVLCAEHDLLVEFWFYEKEGFRYCPEGVDMDTGQPIPHTEGMDVDMAAYRKRYCDWIAALSPEAYLGILKHQIGDDEETKPK